MGSIISRMAITSWPHHYICSTLVANLYVLLPFWLYGCLPAFNVQYSVRDFDYILPETLPKCLLALATEGRALFYDLSTTGNKLALWLIVGAVGHSSLMGCWRVLSGFAQWADAWFTIYMPAPHSQRWGVRGFSYTAEEKDRATAIWWAGEGEGQRWKWGGSIRVVCEVSHFHLLPPFHQLPIRLNLYPVTELFG